MEKKSLVKNKNAIKKIAETMRLFREGNLFSKGKKIIKRDDAKQIALGMKGKSPKREKKKPSKKK